VAAPRGDFDARALDVHGHRVIYRIVGTGPPVVLIHGMVNSSRHWKAVAERLAPDYTVIAPDLLGHGDSAKPEGDYSLGAHAAGIRDLLAFLGIDRATMVGHSLGGGVAMQFFYQFPERCERLVLVSSGGLGREVSAPLRLAAMPGAHPALALAAHPRLVAATDRVGAALARPMPAASALLRAIARARRAFLQTLRSVIGMTAARERARSALPARGHAHASSCGASVIAPSRSSTAAAPTPRRRWPASSRSRAAATSPTSSGRPSSPSSCATSSRPRRPRGWTRAGGATCSRAAPRASASEGR